MELPETDGNHPEFCGSEEANGDGDVLQQRKEEVTEKVGCRRLGKKQGRKPKKKEETLQVQEAERETGKQSGEKVEKLEVESPENGQAMEEKCEDEGAGAEHIRRRGRKKGSRTGGKVTRLKKGQNGFVSEKGKACGEELQESTGKDEEDGKDEENGKDDENGKDGLKGKKKVIFTENQEDKELENEMEGKIDGTNEVILKWEDRVSLEDDEGVNPEKRGTDLGNQGMDTEKGKENVGSVEVRGNSYWKRLRANDTKVSYAESSEDDEEVLTSKKPGRKGRKRTKVRGKEGSEMEVVDENGCLAEGNGKEVNERWRKKNNKEKDDGEWESLNSCIGYSLCDRQVFQQDVKDVKMNKYSEEVSNLLCAFFYFLFDFFQNSCWFVFLSSEFLVCSILPRFA